MVEEEGEILWQDDWATCVVWRSLLQNPVSAVPASRPLCTPTGGLSTCISP